jgi:acyl-coenzyme A synthetase/AMP-(fatty) acid ligase
MNGAATPAFGAHAPGDVVIWQRGEGVTATTLEAEAAGFADALPDARYVINLCEGRRHFLTAFLAAASRGRLSLLPTSRAPQALAELRAEYPDHCIVTDEFLIRRKFVGGGPGRLRIEVDRPVVRSFTSGSTGRPEGHEKSWGCLLATASLARERLLASMPRFNVVATVPSQHMYGLETTLSLILLGGGAVSDGRPLLPADVALELESVPAPRVLVTTPAHLRACVAANLRLPALERVISATAPLERPLAEAAEGLWHTRVHEIYGCTEAGSMATRRTIEGESWRAHAGTRVEPRETGAVYHGAHLAAPIDLQDLIAIEAAGTFRLVGRATDMIKVAGKRASLAELTRRLLSVPGVNDAVVFMPEDAARPAALVVAPGLSREALGTALAAQVDPVFVPRPMRLVDALPRNENGKLPRAALLAALGAR